MPSDRLATALAVRALVESGASTEQAERGMNWLLSHRVEGGFGTTTETAAFVGAAAAWISKNRPSRFGGTIHVLADGTDVRTVKVVPGQGLAPTDRRFAHRRRDELEARPAHARLPARGRGRVRWAARLEVVEAAEVLAADEHGLRVERLYLDAATPVAEGAEMPAKPGYEILRPAARPKVEAAEPRPGRDRRAPARARDGDGAARPPVRDRRGPASRGLRGARPRRPPAPIDGRSAGTTDRCSSCRA